MTNRAKGFDDPRPRKPFPDYDRDWPRLIAKALINNETGCWEWQAAKTPKGYGIFGTGEIRPNGSSVSRGAHAVAYTLANGLPALPELCVLHKCDNSSCINPDHLFLGTREENNEDMRQKRRQSVGKKHADKTRGSLHGMAVLNEEQVVEIKALIRETWGVYGALSRIAAEYGVSLPTISAIKHGRLWGHLAERGVSLLICSSREARVGPTSCWTWE